MPERHSGSKRGEVLVALVNNQRDWQIVRERHWYRIPVHSAPKTWPPQWLALYQTKVFGDEAFAIRYVGKVSEIRQATRKELFPDESSGPKSSRHYFQVFLESVEALPEPIVSYRLRLIVFIPTTLYKLETAVEVNDLFDESPLEDAIWTEMKRLELPAERQFFVEHDGDRYALDFAVFCEDGKLDIEADGDTWHADKARIADDNLRNNALAAQGWKVLRFNGMQVREQMAEYCVPQIVETVNRLGGVSEANGPPRTYIQTKSGIEQQLRLFDERAPYRAEEPER